MTLKSNAHKIAGQFMSEANRTRKDFGFLMGGLVGIASESVEEKGIAKRGAIPAGQQYATVFKGRASKIKSTTRPVDRTGALKSVFSAFGNFMRHAEQYALTRNGMSGHVFRLANATGVKWSSVSAKIGALENRGISSDAKKPIAGMKASEWPSATAKNPRRFISKRFNPAKQATFRALQDWGKTFSVDFGRSRTPRKPKKITVTGE